MGESGPNGILTVFELTFCISCLVGLIGLIKPFRRVVAALLMGGHCLCFFLVWLWCLFALGLIWGAVPVIVGLLLGVAGVIPVALVMFLFTRHWTELLNVVVLIATSSALRYWWFAYARSDRR